jgi:D-amino-acid oxidase
VTVIGGGVCGLTTALRLKRQIPSVDLQVVGEKIASRTAASDPTTSEGAAGLWKPFALSGTPDELVNRWGKETLDHYMDIYLSGRAPEAGILLSSAYELFEEPLDELPAWADVVPAFRRLTPADISFYDPSGRHVDGYSYDTIIAEGRLYLGWICRELEGLGVTIVERKVSRVDEIEAGRVIVDCCGLGSRELFQDPELFGIRGHVLRVKAPWVRHHVESHGVDATRPAYIIPNTDTVVLGGTKERSEDRTSTAEERQEIFDRCKAIVPSLEAAELVGHWVGLRPGREGIRLEMDEVDGRVVVHNVGHGGSGLTLAWGCAGDVVELLKPLLV